VLPDVVLQATRPLLAPAFTLLGSPVTVLELIAFVLALAMVVCNLRVNPLGWPLAIASSLLYALLFADSRLYGEAVLQGVFIVLAVWGWWQWMRGSVRGGRPLHVRRMGPGRRAIALVATLAAWPLLGMLLARHTDTDVPYLDALATVVSVTGQLMLGRKLVENWAVWGAVNVFSVGLFAYKGLWLTALLYAIFAALSWLGWRTWRRLLTA